jgi:hypothetical protein
MYQLKKKNNHMKSVFSTVLAICFSLMAMAQSNKEDIAIIQSMFGKAKKDLVSQYMTIPADKTDAFWKTYDAYEADRTALGRERIKLIEDYANSYAALDDKTSDALMKRKMKWLNNFAKMQSKYYGSMSKIIGSAQASKFMQLEDYIENNIRLAVQESIPFIGEIDVKSLTDGTKK